MGRSSRIVTSARRTPPGRTGSRCGTLRHTKRSVPARPWSDGSFSASASSVSDRREPESDVQVRQEFGSQWPVEARNGEHGSLAALEARSRTQPSSCGSPCSSASAARHARRRARIVLRLRGRARQESVAVGLVLHALQRLFVVRGLVVFVARPRAASRRSRRAVSRRSGTFASTAAPGRIPVHEGYHVISRRRERWRVLENSGSGWRPALSSLR